MGKFREVKYAPENNKIKYCTRNISLNTNEFATTHSVPYWEGQQICHVYMIREFVNMGVIKGKILWLNGERCLNFPYSLLMSRIL